MILSLSSLKMESKNIIRDFQACLNEAIAKGWSWGFINWIWSRYKRACREDWIWNGEDYEDREVLSYNDLLFWSYSWFLDMIEWKQEWYSRYQYAEYWDRDLWGIEDDDKQYHKMQLSLLESDELRMQYILDNIKWFITKK